VFEIGYSLRSARERQGLGFPEVELATKIRAKYIRAIEAEDFESLPGDTYTRGFLRTYANYLGLDGETYVEEYASRFHTSWEDDLQERPERRRVRRRERRVERRAVVLVLVGIAVLTALVFTAYRYGGKSTRVPGVRTGLQRQTVSTRAGLVLRGVGKGTYVVVRRGTASGKVLLEGTVNRGEIDRLSGTRFYLLVRRPSRLHVALGGRAVALPGVRNLRVLVTAEHTTRLTR
jgi:hypothetical protein